MPPQIKYFESDDLIGHGRALVIIVLNRDDRDSSRVMGEYHVLLPDAPQPRILEAQRLFHQPGLNGPIDSELVKYFIDDVFVEILKREARSAIQRLADTLGGRAQEGVDLREVGDAPMARLLMVRRYEDLVGRLHASSSALREAGLPNYLEPVRFRPLRTE